jgi:hypothetical protein
MARVIVNGVGLGPWAPAPLARGQPRRGTLVARTITLLDLYGGPVLRTAVDDLLAEGSHDYGALAILCQKRRKRPRRALPIHVIPHDLGGYDDDHK